MSGDDNGAEADRVEALPPARTDEPGESGPRWSGIRTLSPALEERFVGRTAERERFHRIIQQANRPKVILLHGPVGVGKTWFLRLCMGEEASAAIPHEWCRAPSAELQDMAHELVEMQARLQEGGGVILCDWNLTPAETEPFVLDRCATDLPDGITLVVTSRQAPRHGWMLHDGWGASVVDLGLGPVSRREAMELVKRLSLPEHLRETVVNYGVGSPLLLTLAAQTLAYDSAAFRPQGVDDAVRPLLPRLGVNATTASHQEALWVAAMARGVTPDMLRRALDDRHDAAAAFRWLANRSFVDDTEDGLRMHEVVRRGLLQELRVHYPTTYRKLRRTLKEYCLEQVETAVDTRRWVSCLFYLDRQRQEVQPYLSWEGERVLSIEVARSSDWDPIHRAVLEHEGERSVRILQHWASSLPESIEVVRGGQVQPKGAIVSLPLDRSLIDANAEMDPALDVLRQYIDQLGIDDTGALGVIHRYWLDLESYQAPSRVLTELMAHIVVRGLALGELPLTAAVVQDGAAWLRFASIIGVPVECAGEFELDGKSFSVLVILWLHQDRAEWLQDFAMRQVEDGGQAWWRSVASRAARFGGDVGGGLRETLRPGGPARSAPPNGTPTSGGLGDLIMQRMKRLAKEAQLTKRETEVLDLLMLGRNTEEIALVLDISPRTAKFHQSNVLRKLGADSRAELVRLLL
ncbi:MAG: LuxR C-terminal-related transcriptional regulator [Myxococcota bacterium]